MSSIIATPTFDSNGNATGGLGLSVGNLIVGKVAATNVNGTGEFSNVNTAGV